jgi:hypothetical protein
MIFVFKKPNGEHLLISAKTEDEALNLIKACGMELVHGTLHTELKFVGCYSSLIVERGLKIL